jgi:uncharacterized membrane protein
MPAYRQKLLLWIVAGLTTTAFAFGVGTRLSRSGSDLIASDGSDSVTISASSIAPGQARFFIYQGHSGVNIRLILARDDQGDVEAGFDACERCYMYRRGYEAAHGVITCRWCGTHYKIASMSEGLSGCAPIKVPFRIMGDTIRIQTADLERRSKLF